MTRKAALGFLLLCLGGCAGGGAAPAPVAGEDPAPPPAAEGDAAFAKGVEAAQRADFASAAVHFRRAQEISPYAPNVLLNLGLAYGKGGNQILGSAWLQAYLAVAPAAANAEAVRKEMAGLIETARRKFKTSIETAIAAAGKLPAAERTDARIQIAFCLARSGELSQAVALVEKAEDDGYQGVFESSFVGSLIEAGDFVRAYERIEKLPKPEDRASLAWNVFTGKLALGDEAGAREALKRVPQPPEREAEAVFEFGRRRLRDGDPVPLETYLPRSSGPYRGWCVELLAQEYLEKGRGDDALRLARSLEGDENAWTKAAVLGDCALHRLEAGDLQGAREIARELLRSKEDKNKSLAAAVLGNGDAALVLIKAPEARLGYSPFNTRWWGVRRDFELGKLAYVQALSGDLSAARSTAQNAASRPLQKEHDDDREGWPDAYLALALTRKGDVGGALPWIAKSLPWVRSVILDRMARLRMEAGDVDGAARCLALLPLDPGEHPHVRWRTSREELALRRMKGHLDLAVVSPAAARIQLRHVAEAARKAGVVASPVVLPLLVRTARDQEQARDPEGAAATRRLIPAKGVGEAVHLATQLSQDRGGDLEGALQQTATAAEKDLPAAIARAALDSIGKPLLSLNRARSRP